LYSVGVPISGVPSALSAACDSAALRRPGLSLSFVAVLPFGGGVVGTSTERSDTVHAKKKKKKKLSNRNDRYKNF
jgi:hypothetical protein